MKKLREVKDDLLKEWIEFRVETAFCKMSPQDKKYCIYFDEIAEKILKYDIISDRVDYTSLFTR